MKEAKFHKLLKGCLKNDRKAQEALYRHYFGLMYHICKGFAAEREEILSLVNEGFLKIFLSLENFDPHKGNFESWAKRIVTNNCIDSLRNKRKNQTCDEIGEKSELHAEENSAYVRMAEKEIMQCLSRLPRATQLVFNLYVFKGFSHGEIAKNLRIAESTSRWHVLEARKTLRKVSKEIL